MSEGYYDVTTAYYGFGPDIDPKIKQLSRDSLHYITEDEYRILERLRAQITNHVQGNKIKQAYYEARQIVKHMDISVPANLSEIGVAVGWAGTTVDALDERVDFLGWTTDDRNLNGLDEAFNDNNLAVESNYGHLDSFTTGTSFVSVGNNEDQLPGVSKKQQLITVESSSTASVLWDYRKRRSTAGLSQTTDEKGNVMAESLYLENANIVFMREDPNLPLEIVKRDQHNIGRCFMTRLPNKVRPFQMEGRSEITKAVRYYTDAAVRTMLGMEVNREFYNAPQRIILNARPEDFQVTPDMTPDQRFRRGLSIAMGMINIVPPREDNTEGDPPSVHEFKPQPPTPYIEQIKAYSIQMSAETGLPATLFGFVTDNPTSADAIVKSEFRLTRRASRRIGSLGTGWKEVGILTLLARDGSVDLDFVRRLRSKFANPMLPTPAATADEIQKMVASKVLVPDSSVTYELYGRLDDQMIKQLEKDKQAYEAKLARQAMQEQAQAAAVAARQNGGQPGQNGTKPATNGSQQASPAKKPPAEVGAR